MGFPHETYTTRMLRKMGKTCRTFRKIHIFRISCEGNPTLGQIEINVCLYTVRRADGLRSDYMKKKKKKCASTVPLYVLSLDRHVPSRLTRRAM